MNISFTHIPAVGGEREFWEAIMLGREGRWG